MAWVLDPSRSGPGTTRKGATRRGNVFNPSYGPFVPDWGASAFFIGRPATIICLALRRTAVSRRYFL
jgi:hypothetical protein